MSLESRFKRFNAPWGATLVTVSVMATALCLGIAVASWPTHGLVHFDEAFALRCLLPLVLVVGCALFCVRGYTLTADELIIHRPFWQTRIPLLGLQSAEFQPRVMHGSIRTFGNGGFFSFTGYYRNARLGSYRAFVTDFARTAVLRFGTRTIVLSPEAPEEFVRELSTGRLA